MSATAALLSQTSRRGGIWLAIAAAHALAIYFICTVPQVRAMFEQPAVEASIIDMPVHETTTPPPPAPEIVSVTPPTFDPPVITLPDEPPAPNAITVAVTEAPPPPPPAPAATPRVVTDVAYLEPPAPRYPPESRRSGEEGLVVLRVLIDEAGRAAKVEVQRSSGYARLDAAARLAVERALFRPYVENGVPRTALATIPIEFTWKSHRG